MKKNINKLIRILLLVVITFTNFSIPTNVSSLTENEIAKQFNVSQRTISGINLG